MTAIDRRIPDSFFEKEDRNGAYEQGYGEVVLAEHLSGSGSQAPELLASYMARIGRDRLLKYPVVFEALIETVRLWLRREPGIVLCRSALTMESTPALPTSTSIFPTMTPATISAVTGKGIQCIVSLSLTPNSAVLRRPSSQRPLTFMSARITRQTSP